jgi:pentapeptide MXKDX repeat protein
MNRTNPIKQLLALLCIIALGSFVAACEPRGDQAATGDQRTEPHGTQPQQDPYGGGATDEQLQDQPGTYQDGTQQPGMRHDGTQQHGMQQDGMHQDGMRHDGTQQPGMHQDGMQQDGMQQDGMQQDGMQQDDQEPGTWQ